MFWILGGELVKYEFLAGSVKEFQKIYGVQVEGDGEAQVLLPQWVGTIQIPAYVKVKKWLSNLIHSCYIELSYISSFILKI